MSQKFENESLPSSQGTVVIYKTDDESTFQVQLKDETVWLTQSSIAELFNTTVPNISMHIRNIYKEEELQADGTVKKFLTVRREGRREVNRELDYFNLDVIISVGYRVKSSTATKFRIWATKILRDHLVKGFTLNHQRLTEKGVHETQQILALLTNTLDSQNLVNDEGRSVLDIVNRYARTWQLLLQYDENKLPSPKGGVRESVPLHIDGVRAAIGSLKEELVEKGEATDLFGNERSDTLAGIIVTIHQTFDGKDLYPSIEEKAANLLYFVVKDHPFTDGNKRIGSFLFLLFLQVNGILDKKHMDNKALVALTLLTASSDPGQKELLVRLIVNLLSEN